MAKWDGKSRGTAVGYKILLFILDKGGPVPVYLILYFIVFYYFLFASTFKPTYWYFRNIHRFSVFKSIVGVYRSYYSLAVALVDKSIIYSREEPGFKMEFTGEVNLKEFTSKKTGGGVLLSAHAGSWEMAAHFLKKYDAKANLVLLQADHERIKKIMESSMHRFKDNSHLNVIPIIPGSFDHIFEVRAALERNELVTMNADRYTDDNKTITMDFLGHSAEFPAGPFQLAAMYRAPVSMVFGFKESAKKYHLYGIKPLFPTENETRDEYARRALNYYIAQLEAMLKKYPYQWYNFFYFWNRTKF